MKQEQPREFQDLKEALVRTTVLKIYQANALDSALFTEALVQNIAGILMQMTQEEQPLLPVYYVSKKTTEAERNYNSWKLELKVVNCVERLLSFLNGVKFTVCTDCQALVYLNVQKTQNPQIARWYPLLSEYDMELKYRPGQRMTHVDVLSHAANGQPSDTVKEVY